MMSTMLAEDGITFKEFEKKTFQMICQWGQEYTREFLERYDEYLMQTRDKKAYRHKGLRKTSVKTVYGEVEYERRVYKTTREDGTEKFVFLLDEQLKIPSVGLISENMAEQLVMGITEMSYRECAAKVTEMTGQTISAMGVWNVIQELGRKVCEDEESLVNARRSGIIQGEKETPVLFEETDGVYVRLQNEKKKKAEIKVGIAYDGWKEIGKNRYALDNKVVVAGISSSREFQRYREAAIAEVYDTAEIDVRLMNADGAEWVKNISEVDTIFQLDPFHRNKAIRENIPHVEAAEEVRRYLDKCDVEGMFDFLETYRNSLTEDEEIEKVDTLLKYFENNKDGLLPYQERGLSLPDPPEGIVYRNMGTMENHVWSVIARRMKHNHTCWSIKGGNHLAKILAKKCSGRIDDVTVKLKSPEFEGKKVREIQKEILMAGQVPKKVGKGYEYPVRGHLTKLNGPSGAIHRTMLAMVGCQ